MSKKNLNHFEYSPDGVKYKFPERSCKKCVKYPCFVGMEKRSCDFAKYGCIEFENNTR